jgi:hypothetical protein
MAEVERDPSQLSAMQEGRHLETAERSGIGSRDGSAVEDRRQELARPFSFF